MSQVKDTFGQGSGLTSKSNWTFDSRDAVDNGQPGVRERGKDVGYMKVTRGARLKDEKHAQMQYSPEPLANVMFRM